MKNILMPYFSYNLPINETDSCPEPGQYDFYRCVALKDIQMVKKGDYFEFITLDIFKKEIRGYSADPEDPGAVNLTFTLPFNIQINLT